MKTDKGITLVALIITIIVMLILVGVSVQVVIKSDLLGTAQEAVTNYKEKMDEESTLSKIKVGELEYDSLEEYIQTINTIKFYVNDVEYTAEKGMTWREFIKSDYCADGVFLLVGAGVITSGSDYSDFSDDTQLYLVEGGALNIWGPNNKNITLGDKIIESFVYLDSNHISL